MDSSIAAIVLAAGGSKRFGSPKQLLKWEGVTLINRVIHLALTFPLDPVIVVLGSNYEIIKENIIDKEKVRIVKNDDWGVGQSTSLIAGVKEIEAENIPFVVLLCDQPQITEKNVQAVIKTFKESKTDVVITEIEGKMIPPVIFSPFCIPGISKLKGDRGARSIIEEYQYKTYKETDSRILMDIDTKEDFIQLKKTYNCV
jgi:molybdenum cofactor cytidylyltransferase